MLIKEADISKNTFYNNFGSMDNLMHYIIKKYDEKIYFKFKNKKIKSNNDLYYFISIEILPIIYSQKDIFKILYNSDIKFKWEEYLINYYLPLIEEKKIILQKYSNIYKRLFIKKILIQIEVWITEPVIIDLKDFQKIFIELNILI